MKITYLANTRMPTEMAHGLHIMKMCEAFAKNGAEVELIIPRRFSISKIGEKDPFQYYKVEKIFKIKEVFCFDLTPLNRFLGPVSFLTQAFSFAFFAFIYILFRKSDIIYSRDRFSLFFLIFLRRNIILEIHQTHRSLFKFILNKVKRIVVITNGLKRILERRGIDGDKIIVAPDAISLKDFENMSSREECRKKLGLPIDKKIVLYTGHLYKWKGIDTLALASRFLSKDILIVIVGGIKWYLTDFKKFIKKNNLENVLALGHKDYSLIPDYLGSADCLVLTGTAESEISKTQTSPMKMFEYMASLKPIIASDLPSFKEVLNQDNCVFVESDNPEAMAIGIEKVLNDSILSQKISEQAYQDVKKHTWDSRVKRIMELIS